MISPSGGIIIAVIVLILFLISIVFGIFCLIRYARTRKYSYLIIGMILTFLIPGVVFCLFLIWIPSTIMAYAPPPPDFRP